ncbi:MAG: 16S rRNA (uracil(1498)-N(3))-methyltransferase [Cohaesibacteraceae bacterium]|nr:16S rRNA (uracil(1498)-N(3))-methyltransferase [Cohaesibacteraceae bacterium]
MARYDFRTQRLFLTADLAATQSLGLDKSQSSYLISVLRKKKGDAVLLFNGRHGEWLGEIAVENKKNCVLTCVEQIRPQTELGRVDLLFAPLKHARLDYMVQKAVEMGVANLRPVMTHHTQVKRVNVERMRANVIEAAEQCGVLAVPRVAEPVSIFSLLDQWQQTDPERHIIYCDESDLGDNPLLVLQSIASNDLAVFIGPEGGFSREERDRLKLRDDVTAIPLGPRILRADTAAVAALALVQAVLGDWTL